MAYDAESPPKADRSFSTLLTDLAAETTLLIRQEVRLFKAELAEKLGRLGQGAGFLIAGGLFAFSGWLVLLAAAVLGLALVVQPWLAAVIVGVIVLAIGGILVLVGKSRFDSDALVPRRTLNSLREDEAWIKEQLR